MKGEWPHYSDEEIEAVNRVLRSGKVNYWTGAECRKFEEEFANYVESHFAIAVANGTVALELALLAIGIEAGDEVVLTSRTFIASASAVVRCGGIPIFADVDPESQNITATTIAEVLSSKTKAIICVHLAGWPCDMDPILDLASARGIRVVEDCAQAHGARYKGKSVGALGDVAAWSFCQDKIISTGGEGGMVTTNDESLWKTMWSFKDHGKNPEKVFSAKIDQYKFRWLHDGFGTNLRLTEIQAAIGRQQLERLEDWNKERRRNLEAIHSCLGKSSVVRVPSPVCESCDCDLDSDRGCRHAAYKAYVFANISEEARDDLVRKINEAGIKCFSGSCSEIYKERAFTEADISPSHRLEVAKTLGEQSLMFLCHPGLHQEVLVSDMDKVIELIADMD